MATEITPESLHQFLRKHPLRGGRLRAFRVAARPGDDSRAVLRIAVRAGEAAAKLSLRFEGLEEYRFQRRPGTGMGRLKDVRFGFFNGLTYLDLDSFPEDGPPKVMDFRASDCFLAARRVTWEVVPAA